MFCSSSYQSYNLEEGFIVLKVTREISLGGKGASIFELDNVRDEALAMKSTMLAYVCESRRFENGSFAKALFDQMLPVD